MTNPAEMGTFESIILAIIAAGLIYLFARNAGHAMKNTRKAEPGEWMSVIKPLALVVGFVVLLIFLAKS